jgi:membrane-associated phospholipid phosphatase
MSSFLILAVLGGAAAPAQVPAVPPRDPVLVWNEAALRAVRAERTPPPQVARHLAMLHVAIYDAVNAVQPTHRFYRFPSVVAEPTSAEAAAAVAAHRILVELYPRQVEAFDATLDETLAAVPDSDAKDAGVTLGQSVAEKVLAWRRDDGSARTMRHPGHPFPGLWRPTPPGYRQALLPQWRFVTPFAMRGPSQFPPTDPPLLTSREYAAAFAEVKALGERNSAVRTAVAETGGRAMPLSRALGERNSAVRTADQTVIAWFWNDDLGTVTPPGHWNRIAGVVSRERGPGLHETARLFALLNVTLADAAILCWECKFRYSLWRPIDAIREADRDGNPATDPDPAWTPLLTTPNFPSYTSGHSTFSGAGATALALFFGTDAVRFRIDSDGLPGVVRDYPGFWAAAEEAGRSRIYGGIHYEFDNREGLAAGSALAAYVAENFFRPRSPVAGAPGSSAPETTVLRPPAFRPAIRSRSP